MAKYLYQYNEERGDFYGYVEDADGNDIWSVSYPELIEDEESGELYATPTIFDDGFMKNPDDVEGLEDYLKSIGILEKGDELVSERDDMEDDDDDDEYAEGGEISEVDGNTEVRVGNFTFYFDGVGDMARLTEIYHRPTDMMGDFDSYHRINLSQMKNTPNSKLLLVFEHPTMGIFQLRGGFQILKERPVYVDGSIYAEGGEISERWRMKKVYTISMNSDTKVEGERMPYFYLHGLAEDINGYDICNGNIHTIQDCLSEGAFLCELNFLDGSVQDAICFSKFRFDKMGGLVVLLSDVEHIEDAIDYLNYKSFPLIEDSEEKYLSSIGLLQVISNKMKSKYAEGGETEEYAKGGEHDVNPNYDYFALNKKNNKIYDAWEIVDDVESLKYYAKMDLKDNDLNPSDFNLLSAKTLKARGIDPFSWDSWAKDEDYYANGGVIKWQDVNVGDSARVKAENKTGLIVHTYGRKFHLKFANGSEKTYDASELEFIQNDDDEFAKGGVIQSIKNKLEIANKLISDEKTMIDIDEGREVKYMPLKLKGQRNDLVITIKVKENGRWVNYHNYLVTEWDEGYGEETRLEALNRIIKELKTSKVELMADGGYMAKGGGLDKNWVVEFHSNDYDDYKVIRVKAKSESDAINKGFKELSEMGEDSDSYSVEYAHIVKYADGGMFGKGGVVVPDDRLKTHEQSDDERELELYIDNDVTLYNQRKFPIEKNLIGKLASGKFDINQAPKIYKYLIDDGIKKYTKDFGGITLTKADKENLAKNYVNQFLEDADSGQFDEFIPKKYRMAEGGETDGSDDLLEFTIPNWALSSLINGDDSGLEDEDIDKIEKFVHETSEKYGNAHFMLPSEEEMDLGFKYRNDIDNLGSDCSLLYLRPSKEYADGGYMAKGGETEDYASGGNVRSLLSQFQKEKPSILIQMIADDVSSDFMRKKFDKTIVWNKLNDSQKKKYNEDYRENKFDFEKYLMYEFVRLYYSDNTIKNKCKGQGRATINAIKSIMVSLAKKYPENKYGMGGATFDDKVTSISKSLLERKKVSPKVQKDYGKTYNKKEAIESAKRIAGALRKKEMAKKKG